MQETNEAKQEMYNNAHKEKKIDNQDKPKSKRRRMKRAEVIRKGEEASQLCSGLV